MKISLLPKWITFASLLTFFVVQTAAQKKDETELEKTSEVFRVNKVGQVSVAETRELLMTLYGEIEKDYNAKLALKAKAKEIAYRGNQVRVLKVLEEKDQGDTMYLAAYQGKPVVIAIDTDEQFKVGKLTPSLKIEEAGTHTTKVTREIVERTQVEREPSLEKVDSGGAVTFFGIPLDTGGSSSTSSAPETEEKVTRKRVTEEKTMAKYRGEISKEVLTDGPPKFSQQRFLESVKNGEVYTVKQIEERRCQNCRGFQRVTTTMPVGFRDPDGKMPCPPCRAVGKIKWDVTYQVAW